MPLNNTGIDREELRRETSEKIKKLREIKKISVNAREDLPDDAKLIYDKLIEVLPDDTTTPKKYLVEQLAFLIWLGKLYTQVIKNEFARVGAAALTAPSTTGTMIESPLTQAARKNSVECQKLSAQLGITRTAMEELDATSNRDALGDKTVAATPTRKYDRNKSREPRGL